MPLAHPPSVGPQTVEVIGTEEKGSDVNLASYLLLDGFRSGGPHGIDPQAAGMVSGPGPEKLRRRGGEGDMES